MPKKAIVKQPAAKKPRATSVAQIKLGGEPVLDNPSQIELIRAFNWFTACSDQDKVRGWVVAYMEKRGVFTKEQIAEMKSRGKKFSPTMGALARLRCNGSTLEAKRDVQLVEAINEFLTVRLDDEDAEELVTATKAKPVARDRTNLIASAVADVIEDHVDLIRGGKSTEKSIYQKIADGGCTPSAAKLLKDRYKSTLEEFADLIAGDDQLVEAYAYLPKKRQKLLREFFSQLQLDLAQFAKVKRTMTRARKPRKVNVNKVVARVKFCQESTEYKVASISPGEILGAKGLWVFNTKNRVLGYYQADEGLGVKGTTLTGVSSGVGKKLRKPEDVLPEIMKATKVGCQTKFKAIKCKEQQLNGRLNADTVLLKVVK